MTKDELRKEYLGRRQALSAVEADVLSSRLCTVFFQAVILKEVKVLHTFLPLHRKREPDTFYIINRIRTDFPSIRLAIPKVGTGGTLENYYWEKPEQLVENNWGIPEPAFGHQLSPAEMDVVLVPLLAFDSHGHRIGYGKGYYDRFLAMCRPDCRRIGLSFFSPTPGPVQADKFDQPLDLVITPEKTYSF